MPTVLDEKRQELEAKRLKLHEVFEQAGETLDLEKVTSLEGDTAAKAAAIKAMNDEMTDLGKAIEGLEDLLKTRDEVHRLGEIDPGQFKFPGKSEERKDGKKERGPSFGELVIASDAWKNVKGGSGPSSTIDIEVKTLMSTSAGWAPESVRGPRVVLSAQELPRVADLIPQTTTTQTAIKYMEETTYTNAAAETAEGAAKPEAALVLTERTSDVRKIPVWIPVTDELLEDVPRAQDYIENRLTFMVLQRLDGQSLVGDGVAPNLRGFHNVAGIGAQAKGADPTPDAVYKAMTKVRVNGKAIPSGAVFHPNDWQEIRLLRTADGIYIWGSPSEAGPDRIWGLPVVQSAFETEGEALVGDFRNFSELSFRRGIDIKISDSHADYFVKNQLAIRAEIRVALIVYRPAAFAEVTGI